MMEATDGLPEVEPSGRMLGVRPGNAPTPDVRAINPQDILQPGDGGMSVSPNDPMGLRKHRRPASLGGTGRDPVWFIETDDLGPDLQFRQDSQTHGVIEASRALSFQEYQDALAATRGLWSLYRR
jgi:hypothetical protein